MKLRTKILLWLGILLLLMLIILYIVPAYFVRKDVYSAASEIQKLITEDQKQLLNSQKIWTTNSYEKLKENLNSLLFMLYEMKNLSSGVIFDSKDNDAKIWETLTSIAGLDPDVGLIQAHDPKANRTAGITSANAQLYPVLTLASQNNTVFFSLSTSQDVKNRYLGIRLPDVLQVDKGNIYYAFANVSNVPQEILEIHQEIIQELNTLEAEKMPRDLSLEELRGFTFRFTPGAKLGFYWALKMHMIRLLTPLYVKGLALIPQSKLITPEGLIRVDTSQNGFAILSEEIYRKTPLFDDVGFFEKNPPKDDIPISSGTAIFVVDQKSPYVGGVLRLGSTFLTIGAPLQNFARDLALASNKIILMEVKGFWLGFDGGGNALSSNALQKFITQELKDKEGFIKVDKQQYHFTLFNSLEEGKIKLFQVLSVGGEKTILGTLAKLANQLTNRISLQLFFISLGIVLLILIFIGRIGFHVVHPITKLAEATEDVVKGHYDEVKLPDMGKSRDEIAILTRSFGDMVKGLQEREKIRGVLDKVVSKDVADEILKTQIHLGGEDRVVTILFSDIRDFTVLTENLSPQETILILNACMTKVSRVIEGEGGVIDKYVGDEVMAIFGAPTTHPDHALRAVSAGMLVVETLKNWNLQRIQRQHPAIEMGIGIHTGQVVAGNMGSEDRLNYTVLGANVNLAARLCDAAGRNQLIISEHTLKQPKIEESFYVKALSPISLKGFSEPVKIYEVLGFKWEEIT